MTMVQLDLKNDKGFPLTIPNRVCLPSNLIHFNKTNNNNLFPNKSGTEMISLSIPYNQNYVRKNRRNNTGNTNSTTFSKSFRDSSITNGPNLIGKIYKQISKSSSFHQKYSVKQKKIDAYLYFLHAYLIIIKSSVIELIDFAIITGISKNITDSEIQNTDRSSQANQKNVYKNEIPKTNRSYQANLKNIFDSEIQNTDRSSQANQKNVYKNEIPKTNRSSQVNQKNVYKNEIPKTNRSSQTNQKNVYKNEIPKTNQSSQTNQKNIYKSEIQKTNQKPILNSGIQKTNRSSQANQILSFRRSVKQSLADKNELIKPNCYFLTHIAFVHEVVIENSMNCNFLYYQCFLASCNELFVAFVVKLKINESRTNLTKQYQTQLKSARNNFQVFPSMKNFKLGRKSFKALGFLNKLLTNRSFFFRSKSKRLSSLHSHDDEKVRNSLIAINGLYRVISSKNSQRF